jgi:hypothetical protein
VDIRARANTTRGLDYEHMIKVRAHKGDMRIGKTPKKLDSIVLCPQHRKKKEDFVAREIKHFFFMYLLVICTPFFENSLFNSCAHFFIGMLIL